jgi:uncharacterized protein with NRDE domain
VCLIGIAVDVPGPWLLAVAANRDEFHDRHAAPAAYWDNAEIGLLAGKDLQAGGTWLGLTRGADGRSLRIGALTNLRPGLMPAGAVPPTGLTPSRGRLVAGFLTTATDPESFLRNLVPTAGDYAGFNLLAVKVQDGGAGVDAWYMNNLPDLVPRHLGPGLHVVSNATLSIEWPKTRLLRAAMADWLDVRPEVQRPPSTTRAGERADSDDRVAGAGAGAHGHGHTGAHAHGHAAADARVGPGAGADQRLAEALLAALADRSQAPDADLPTTGLDDRRERLLSAPFIVDDHYGTRCSTVILVSRDGRVFFAERSFGPGGRPAGTVIEQFTLDASPALR